LLSANLGPVTADQRFVDQVYLDVLNRSAQSSDLQKWTNLLNQGASRSQVAGDILSSPEYLTFEVQTAYVSFLHHLPDPVGLSNGTRLLAGGGTEEQLWANLAGSSEYLHLHPTSDGFLHALYHDTLGMDVDPTSEQAFGSALANGGGGRQVALTIFASDQFRRDLVQSFYQHFDNRPATSMEVADGLTMLRNGAHDQSLRAAIIGSDEYFSRAADVGQPSPNLTFTVSPDNSLTEASLFPCPVLQPTVAVNQVNQALATLPQLAALTTQPDVQAALGQDAQLLQQTGGLLATGEWQGALNLVQQADSLLVQVQQNTPGQSPDFQSLLANLFQELNQASQALEGCTAPTQVGLGLATTTFQTPQGQIVVNLPDDMAPGDTISGTVLAEPAGSTPAEQAGNTMTLDGYVVSIETYSRPVQAQTLHFTVGPAPSPRTTYLILRDSMGHELGQAAFPITQASSAPTNFQLPRLGQAGQPVQITGPFSGDFTHTQLSIGGQTAQPLAESPRQLVVTTPSGPVGPATLMLQEGTRTAQGPFNIVKLSLTAPTTTLTRGQHVYVTATVEGLQGVPESWLVLRNQTPDVATLDGGDDQFLVIHPSDLQPDGRLVLTRMVTGKKPGVFAVDATLTTPVYNKVEDPNHHGTTVHTGVVDQEGMTGTVVVRTGVSVTNRGDNWIAVSYTGDTNHKYCIVQFIWSELIVYRGDKSESVSGQLHTTGGDYPLTTDPSDPQWHVDSTSPTDPCDEPPPGTPDDVVPAGGIVHGKDSITLYDKPESNLPAAGKALKDPAVTKIVSIDHFQDIVYCDGQPVYSYSWACTYVWSPKSGESGPYYIDEGGKAGQGPNAAQQKELDKFPQKP
jgi:hypothetical protein